MRQRANAALSMTHSSSSGSVASPTHWKSSSDRDSPHSSSASDSSGQSSAASSQELRHSARVPPGQTSGRSQRPSQPVVLAELPLPAAPAAPPLPAAPAAPLLPA